MSALPNTMITEEAKLPVFANVKPEQATVQVPDEDTQITQITKHVLNAFSEFGKGTVVETGLKTDLENAQEANRGVREKLLVKLATLSDKHDWQEGKITDAINKAVTAWTELQGLNHKANTLGQFKSECFRAMHPAARKHITSAFAKSREAWSAERAEIAKWRVECDNTPKGEDKPVKPAEPLMTTFSKRYHMVAGSKGMLAGYINAASGKKATVTQMQASEPELLAEVRQAAEREDPQRAARLMKRIAEQLTAIHNEFPQADVFRMIKYANTIAANASLLEAAKAERARAQRKAAKKPAVVLVPDDDEDEDETDEDSAVASSVDNLLDC